MGRLRMSTKLNVATLRISSLPPRERYPYLLVAGSCILTILTSLSLAFAGVNVKWSSVTGLLSFVVLVVAVVLQDLRKQSIDLGVKNSTKQIDRHYEELVDRYWRM